MSTDDFAGDDRPVAIVTGAAHGIGLAVALALADDGHALLAVDVDGDELAAANLPSHASRLVHDIADGPSHVLEHLGPAVHRLRVLVNNVGVMDGRSFLDLPFEAAERSFRTNVLGTWRLTKEVATAMVKEGAGGSIVFNLSLHATRVRMCPDYSTSKAALRMLVDELAAELGPHGIRVNAVSPGAVDTWSDRVPDAPEHRARSEALVPLGRLGSPDDVARVVSFLCDDTKSAYVTGADIKVDGGLDTFNWLHHLYGTASAEAERLGATAIAEA